MSEHASALRAEDNLDRERPTNRFWSEVYWITQFFSLPGIVIGYFWIAGAYSSQRNGNNADHVNIVGGLAWDLGVVPVMIATGLMTTLLMFLGWKASGWAGVVGALLLQGVLALVLYIVLMATSVVMV